MNSSFNKDKKVATSKVDALKMLMAAERAAAKDPNHPLNIRMEESLKVEAESLERIRGKKIN